MTKKSKLSTILSCLVAIGVATILIVAPVKRGMFFRQDYLPFFTKASWFFIAVAVILIIQRHNIWEAMPDLALLAVVALYGLTIFWAKNRGAAIDGALKYCVYLGIFLSAKYASKDRLGNTLLRWSIVASGVVAAMVGLLTAAGVISYEGAVVGARIYGSFQYPNALAAYEMFVCFILLHAWFETKNLKQPWARWLGQVLFSLSGFIVLLVIVLSYSRATWIIFAAALVAYFAMLPPKARSGIFLRFMTAFVPVLAVNVPMATAIPEKQHTLVQKYMLVGAAICLGIEIIRTLLTTLVQSRSSEPKASAETGKPMRGRPGAQKSPKAGSRTGSALSRVPAIIAIILAAALVLGFTTETGQQMLAKVVPESVIRRFKSITLTDRSLVTRFVATKDAFSIAKDNPLGTGAGGWDALYHRYQSILYWFTETHNHFAQVLVETGFAGLLAYTAFWISAMWAAFKAWRLARRAAKSVPGISTGVEVSELVSTAFAVLALVVHSSADFDLSLPAIAMALFAATGSLLGSTEAVLSLDGLGNLADSEPDASEPALAWKFLNKGTSSMKVRHLLDALSLIVLAVIIMVPANKYYKGIIYGGAGAGEFYNGNERGGQDFMYKAMEYDPHTSSYALDIAASYFREYNQTKNPGTAKIAKMMLDIARDKNPYSLGDRVAEFQMLSTAGLYDDATALAYEITEMIPLDIRFYEHLGQSAKNAMLTHGVSILSQDIQAKEKQDHLKAAEKYAGCIKEIASRLDAKKADVTGIYEKTWSSKHLDITPPIRLALGQVHFLEGDFEACVENLTLAAKKADLGEEANIWLHAVSIASKANVTLLEGFEIDKQAAEDIALMYAMLSR